jgi:hypothetical protein
MFRIVAKGQYLRQGEQVYRTKKKPDSMARLFVSYLITRKIDMMGLIYGQSAITVKRHLQRFVPGRISRSHG